MSAVGNIERRTSIKMHSRWLNLMPRGWEQQYFAQLEGLDLLNCLITPLFFASTLARWPRSLLGMVYCLVLGIKGYQMALLLLPSARQNNAHAKARYWIILSERLLRQFVATPVLGRGARFVQWMQEAAAADPGPLMAFRLAMLVSGVTHAFWNAFCLPLDITSQVVINSLFFLLHVGPTCAQVGYAVGMLVKHKPRLVWLQWGIEQLCSTLVWPLQPLLSTLAAAVRACSKSSSSSSSSSSTPLLQQQGQGQQADAFALVAIPPGIAPDVETHAGRLVLATSMGLMLLVVLYLPLLFAWRLERHLKARFMATILQRASESNSSSPLSSPAGKGSCSSSSKAAFDPSSPYDPASCTPSSSSADCASSKAAAAAFAPAKGSSSSCTARRSTAAGGTAGGCTAAGGAASCYTAGGVAGILWAADYIKPPAAFPLFPTEKGALRRHLLLAAASCFVLGQIFVWLCVISPLVASTIGPQIAHNPAFTLPQD